MGSCAEHTSLAVFGTWRCPAPGAVRHLAPFGTWRRLAPGAVWHLAPSGTSRRPTPRALRHAEIGINFDPVCPHHRSLLHALEVRDDNIRRELWHVAVVALPLDRLPAVRKLRARRRVTR